VAESFYYTIFGAAGGSLGGRTIPMHQISWSHGMAVTRYEGRTFTKQVFQLEECWFVNCILRECHLFYSGGSYLWENTTFENCDWKFQNAAAQTVNLLIQIGLLKQGQAPPATLQSSGHA
jgi:hypothetical protein